MFLFIFIYNFLIFIYKYIYYILYILDYICCIRLYIILILFLEFIWGCKGREGVSDNSLFFI